MVAAIRFHSLATLLSTFLGTLLLTALASDALAQPLGQVQQPGQGIFPGAVQGGNQGGQQNSLFGNTSQGGQGGGANADFESLIDLIVSTVASDSWAENGGGEAEIRPYPNGVYVDAAGVLKLASNELQSQQASLANDLKQKYTAVRATEEPESLPSAEAAKAAAELRCVSLRRLDAEIVRRQKAKEPLDSSMLTLAGLQRVSYLLVDPEQKDLVLVGPAGDWRLNEQGKLVSVETGQAVVRLDDLISLLRVKNGQPFGCSINPRQEALAEAQAFLAKTSTRPLAPSRRDRWIEQLRSHVGEQDFAFFGIDPASRTAGIMAEADYHMKLIGMGLQPGVPGVESYLASIKLARGESPPATNLLRWWFAMNYSAVAASEDQRLFQIVGPGVQVLSENQLLAERGERIPTGQSDELTQQFASSFTAAYEKLAARYPVYSELRNLFDLALITTLIRQEDLFTKSDWKPSVLDSEDQLKLPDYRAPQTVESVVNYRVIHRKHIVAGVSGGVWCDPRSILREKPAELEEGYQSVRVANSAESRPDDAKRWWWDLSSR